MFLLNKEMSALLALEDGSNFEGFAFAGSGETIGEVVFNTGMAGYQEVITDPSYKDQIVAMTYPLVGEVTCSELYLWKDSKPVKGAIPAGKSYKKLRVAVLDSGVKYNILRLLENNGCEVIVVPANSSRSAILAYNQDGVLLSNGPGDPSELPYIVDTARSVVWKLSVFGICLGQQMIGQAICGYTEKLKFGYHVINLPVKNLSTGPLRNNFSKSWFCRCSRIEGQECRKCPH
jgi:carbamoylphosphate synthase small subunit